MSISRFAALHPRVERWFRQTHGNASVQHAIFVALIVGGALLAIDGLGLVAENTFQQASLSLNAEGAAGHQESAGEGTARSASQAASAESAAAADAAASLPVRLIVLLIVCPLGAACWYWLYRPRRESEDEEDHALPVVAQAQSQFERDLVFEKRHNLLRLFNADVGMLMTSRILVRHVMSDKLHTTSPQTPVEEVARLMQQKKFRHALVCDRRGRLVGLITIRAVEDAHGKTAADIMQSDPLTVRPDSPLSPAITQLIKQRLYCLPVVEERELVGVVTTTDILMAMQCTLHALQKTANEVVADLPPDTVPGFMVAAKQFQDGQPGAAEAPRS